MAALGALEGGLSIAAAQQYPKQHPVAGGIAVIELNVPSRKTVSAKFGRTPILTFTRNGSWIGVVGIELETAQGNYLITLATPEAEPEKRQFSVQPYAYSLKSKRPRSVAVPPFTPPKDWRPELDAEFPLSPPVTTSTIVRFGTRYADAEVEEPERGVVFGLHQNREVFAPGGGVVSDVIEAADEGFFSITIDHGMGMFSHLGPLSRVLKQSGQPVKKGELIGAAAGDPATSAGLYWQTALNGALVDPLLFTAPAAPAEGE